MVMTLNMRQFVEMGNSKSPCKDEKLTVMAAAGGSLRMYEVSPTFPGPVTYQVVAERQLQEEEN